MAPIPRHCNPPYSYKRGPFVLVALRDAQARWLGEDPPVPPEPEPPVPPPTPDPPPPAPEPDPIPPPEPEPVPPPPDDPIPPPPPDDYERDELMWPAPVILVNAKHPQSHRGLYWVKVDDTTMTSWDITSERHLDHTLNERLHERQACVVFCLSTEGEWWSMVQSYVIRRGGVVVPS